MNLEPLTVPENNKVLHTHTHTHTNYRNQIDRGVSKRHRCQLKDLPRVKAGII